MLSEKQEKYPGLTVGRTAAPQLISKLHILWVFPCVFSASFCYLFLPSPKEELSLFHLENLEREWVSPQSDSNLREKAKSHFAHSLWDYVSSEENLDYYFYLQLKSNMKEQSKRYSNKNCKIRLQKWVYIIRKIIYIWCGRSMFEWSKGKEGDGASI